MVREIKKEDKKYYQCEKCDLVYLDSKMAEKCQAWCSKYKSCNLEIIEHAVKDFQK
jgi:hypothetical protein